MPRVQEQEGYYENPEYKAAQLYSDSNTVGHKPVRNNTFQNPNFQYPDHTLPSQSHNSRTQGGHWPQQYQERFEPASTTRNRYPSPPPAVVPPLSWHHPGRHSHSKRPQVRLPQHHTPQHQSADLRVRSSRRSHRSSTSTSSKTSSGSNPWSSNTNVTKSSTPTPTPPRTNVPTSPTSQVSPFEMEALHGTLESQMEDKEWHLLREQTFTTPVQRDKYAHVPSVIRKYASENVPELKMGEPRWANSLMSRKWETEETLEKDKRQVQTEETCQIATCMTKAQDKAWQLAQQSFEKLKEKNKGHQNERQTERQSESITQGKGTQT